MFALHNKVSSFQPYPNPAEGNLKVGHKSVSSCYGHITMAVARTEIRTYSRGLFGPLKYLEAMLQLKLYLL